MNVLIAEDNTDMRKVIKGYFDKEGFKTYLASDGDEAIDIMYYESIDIAIVDWMMPKTNGLEVIKEIKKNFDCKILMLTAKSTTDDELKVLNLGADDYLRKPFDPRVLLTRSKKLLKCTKSIVIGDLELDLESKFVKKSDEIIRLASKEYELLLFLMKNKGMILSKDRILDCVWGYDYEGSDRTVDTHIRRVRQKIGDDHIKTHRGMGYSID